MIRRFNYTGRLDLHSSTVSISLQGLPGASRSFTANWCLPEEYKGPNDAKVVIEAFCSGSPNVMRFDFGTVASRAQPASTNLADLEAENVLFNLKVVDNSGDVGRLLALAESISARSSEADDSVRSHPLLPVLPENLGEQVWRLNFDNNRVVLEVNKAIDNIKAVARHDRAFFSLVYPAAIGRILMQAIVLDKYTDLSGPNSDWRVGWLKWGVQWHPENALPPDGEDEESLRQKMEWIDNVVDGFCRKHGVRNKFIEQQSSEVDS